VSPTDTWRYRNELRVLRQVQDCDRNAQGRREQVRRTLQVRRAALLGWMPALAADEGGG
jgi:hypothetical protein